MLRNKVQLNSTMNKTFPVVIVSLIVFLMILQILFRNLNQIKIRKLADKMLLKKVIISIPQSKRKSRQKDHSYKMVQ